MNRRPVDLDTLLAVVDDPQSTADLADYFQPDRPAGTMPRYSGSRFESLAGGGDRPAVANTITADDLVAVTLLSVDVPGDVALQLLEGRLGQDVSQHLAQIPVDVGIGDPVARELLAPASHADVAWTLLEEPHGMGWVITNKLLARKRPRLIPVYDGVVKCAFGEPDRFWSLLLTLFADGRLEKRLSHVRSTAGVPETVTPLRVLDVIVWMRHRPVHTRTGCSRPGL